MLFNPLRVKQLALVAGLLASATTAALAQHSSHSAHSSSETVTEPAATHGMLLVGMQHVYASHLPMFHRLHDYQVWLELDLDSVALAAYQSSRRAYPQEEIYTLEPEKFVLPGMVARPRPFRASLYRGHFERGGTAIAVNAAVHIKKVLYFRKLNPIEPAAVWPEYLLLGNVQEQFLAHRIGARPDFDQVLRVRVPPGRLLKQLAERGLLEWQAAAGPAAPLAAPAEVRGRTAPALKVEKGIYLEYNDLK